MCPCGGEEKRLCVPFGPAVRSFGTETPWDEMTHHDTVLMRDTHAGLAPVLEEIARSVNPDMQRRRTARATTEGPSSRGEARREGGGGSKTGRSPAARGRERQTKKK